MNKSGSLNPSIEEIDNAAVKCGIRDIGVVVIGGHIQGLGVIRNLGQHNIPVCLLDSSLSIGRFSRYTTRFFRCPPARDQPRFLDFLLTLACKAKLEGWIIFPNDDDTVIFLSRHKKQLEEFYQVPTPPWEITRYASEKKLTYQLAEKFDIDIPRTYYPSNLDELSSVRLNFPLVLKTSIKAPCFRLINKRVIRVNNRPEMMQAFTRIKSLYPEVEILAQEVIPGSQNNRFSIGTLVKGGNILGKVVARRIRQLPPDFGQTTTCAVTVDIPELEQIARKFLRAMGYYGLSEIDFILDRRDGKYKLIDVNARPWGWHTLAIDAGVDLPYLLYLDILGHMIKSKVSTPDIKWFHLTADIPAALGAIFRGELGVVEYFRSLRGRKRDAVLSLNDPLPFLMEILLLPYLRIK
jgi:D-aspartate ligase